MDQQPNLTGTGQPKSSAFWRSRWFAYGFAAVVTWLALLARLSLSPWIGDNRPVLVLFFIPILVSAYLGGLGPGLVATVLAAVGAEYYLIPPYHSFSFHGPMDFAQWLIFVIGGILACALNEALHRARRRADANQRLLTVTLTSIGDAVITTDVQGNVTFLNQEAERLTGWTNTDAAGQPLPTVFRIVNEETRETVEDPVKKVFRSNSVVGLANHTVLISRGGREFIIDDSGAPIRQADGRIIGVVLVFRDNTAKKKAEDVLLRNRRILQQTGHIAKVGGWEFDPATGAGQWGEEVALIHDLDSHTKPNKEMGLSFYPGESRTKIEAAVTAAVQHGTPYDLELEFISAKGIHKWVRTIGQPVVENGKVVRVCGAIQDITDRIKAQAAIRETQALYHSLVAQMPAGIFRKDAAGRYVFVNSNFCNLKAMSAEQFMGKTALELGLEDKALAADGVSHHEQILRTGERIEADEKYLRADGQTLYFHVVKSPVFAADGKIVGSQGIMLDVTAHRLAELALLESEALYHSLVDQMPAGVFRKDAAGRYVFANSWLGQLKGIQPESLLGKMPGEHRHFELERNQPDYSIGGEAHHRTIMRTGRTIEVDEEYPGPNGNPRHLHVVKSPVFDAQGKITGSQGVMFDVTELKNIQDRFQEEHALLRTLMDLAPDFIFIKDLESRFLVVNAALAKCYGQTPAAMLGLTDADFLPPEEATRCRATELQALAANSFCTVKGPITFPVGEPRVVVTNMIAWRDQQGKVAGLIGIGRDITAQEAADQTLRESEARLSTIFNFSPSGIVITRFSDGEILEVNAAFASIHGCTVAELIGRKSSDLGLWDDPAQRDQMIQMLTTAGRCKNLEIKFRKKDNSVGDLIISAELIELAGERCMLGLASDITEQKLAREQFAREQARFKLIFDTVPIGIAFHTVFPDGQFSRIINDAHLRICGIQRDQHNEPDIYARITHPDDQAIQLMFLEQVKAGLLKQYFFEKRYVHADGKVVWVNFSQQREKYPDGTIEELTTVADITERKASEQQLKQFAVIVESSDDAIISKTLDGIITSWNRGAENIFGYPANEAVGQSMLMLIPAERKNEEPEILARIARGESVEHFETERVRKDGKRIRISTTISPIRDSHGQIVGASKIARDITRQHLLEEQLRQSQKMEAIGQLAGGVAHDFNNILAVIQMQIELTKIEGNFSPEQAECLDEIQTAANRAANLTRQLLLFSRRNKLQPRELDLSDSITGMTKMLRRILGEDIQMQFRYAPQPLFIHADAGMMDQLLMNLTVNSRDAMPHGGELIIETAAVEFDELAAQQSSQVRPGAFVRLSVSDTGSGIAPEILPRIFEPFFTTKEVGKGTGLGLATVFSIVQQHQGWISVYSELGQGTTFHIYLPRQIKNSTDPTVEPTALAAAHGGNETILLVEDDGALRSAVQRALAQLGYRVLAAASGAEALQVWEQHRDEIHLLLTDLVMPGGLTGKTLAEKLQLENPKLNVIYASGYSADIAGKDFPLEAGVNFLPKPFPAQLLAETVRRCLDQNPAASDPHFPRRQSLETGEPEI